MIVTKNAMKMQFKVFNTGVQNVISIWEAGATSRNSQTLYAVKEVRFFFTKTQNIK